MATIELTKGYVDEVDDDLYEELNQYLWHVLDSHPVHRYAARWIKGSNPRKVMRMHHQVLNVDTEYLRLNGLVVDHDDRYGLNNRRLNLKVVTRSENAKNSDHWDSSTWIRWDAYRGRYKVVLPDNTFVAWCETMQEAIKLRDISHNLKVA